MSRMPHQSKPISRSMTGQPMRTSSGVEASQNPWYDVWGNPVDLQSPTHNSDGWWKRHHNPYWDIEYVINKQDKYYDFPR